MLHGLEHAVVVPSVEEEGVCVIGIVGELLPLCAPDEVEAGEERRAVRPPEIAFFTIIERYKSQL